jgi:hypothetical protein
MWLLIWYYTQCFRLGVMFVVVSGRVDMRFSSVSWWHWVDLFILIIFTMFVFVWLVTNSHAQILLDLCSTFSCSTALMYGVFCPVFPEIWFYYVGAGEVILISLYPTDMSGENEQAEVSHQEIWCYSMDLICLVDDEVVYLYFCRLMLTLSARIMQFSVAF